MVSTSKSQASSKKLQTKVAREMVVELPTAIIPAPTGRQGMIALSFTRTLTFLWQLESSEWNQETGSELA